MRYPAFLPENGIIGFVAPSFGCATEPYISAFQNALKKFETMGFASKLGPNVYENSGVGISNTPDKCGKELMEIMESEADCIISCGGGELMCEVVPFIDFEKLQGMEPKWYMGYSDNTNFCFLYTTLCDTASVYGPCAAAFGMEPWHKSIQDAMDVLQGKNLQVKGYGKWEKESLKSPENPFAPYNTTEELAIKTYIGDEEEQGGISFEGRLLGGCLDCLSMLCGTKYDKVKEFAEKYREDGIIWFLEACDLNVFSIRRVLWQLKNAGWFENTKGFMIGRPMNGEEMMGLDHIQAVIAALKDFGVPIVLDVDLGHCAPMMPLIEGSIVNVQVCNNEISLKMECR